MQNETRFWDILIMALMFWLIFNTHTEIDMMKEDMEKICAYPAMNCEFTYD